MRTLKTILVVTLALSLVGCTAKSATPVVTPPEQPPATQTTATSGEPTPVVPETPAPAMSSESVYFMKGEKLAAVTIPVEAADTARARAAMLALLAGPDATAKRLGLTSEIPASTRLLGVAVSGGTATVDLSTEFGSGGGSASMMGRAAQVVWTLTRFPTIKRVAFKMNGKPIAALGGEGLILDKPQTRIEWEDWAPAILVDRPGFGDSVSGPLRVTGTANTFEAHLRLTLFDASGKVLARKDIQATSGTGTRGTFSTTLDFDVASSQKGILRASVLSAKDGSDVKIADTQLTLVPASR